MARKDKKFNFIYKTTNLLNENYYIGMHSTDNLEDGYVGSGTYLWRSIKRHGKENHSIEILEFLDDRESLKSRERELVNEETLTDLMCMNLRIGGEGWNSSEAAKAGCIGNRSEKRLKNIQYLKNLSDLAKKTNRIREYSQQGADAAKVVNSTLMWITDEVNSIKIKKIDIVPDGWRKGRVGNFVNKKFLDS